MRNSAGSISVHLSRPPRHAPMAATKRTTCGNKSFETLSKDRDAGQVKHIMCPQCKCGPVTKTHCDDLSAHHGANLPSAFIDLEYSDNRCPNPRCRFFSRRVNKDGESDPNYWLHWDGIPRRHEHDVFPTHDLTQKLQDVESFLSTVPPRRPCWPYLETEGLEPDAMPTCVQDTRESVAKRLLDYLNSKPPNVEETRRRSSRFHPYR